MTEQELEVDEGGQERMACAHALETFIKFCILKFAKENVHKPHLSPDGEHLHPSIVVSALSLRHTAVLVGEYVDDLEAARVATGYAAILSELARDLIANVIVEEEEAEAAYGDANDALRQWQHAERTNDTTELDNARKSRDASISGEKHRPKL